MNEVAAPQPLLATPPEHVQPTGSAAGRGARRLVFLVMMFLVGIALGTVLVAIDIAPTTSLPLAVTLLLLLLALWLATLAHESGHALAARLVGWQLLAVAAGPLTLRHTLNGPRLERNALKHAAGFVYAIPRDDVQLRRRRFIMVAGGPTASLLVALLAVYLVRISGDGLLGTLAFQLGAMSFIISVMTLVPYRYGGLASDGAQMLKLLRGGPGVEQQLATQLLLAALVGGVRPRDLDEALMTRALATGNPTDTPTAHYLAYWRDMDRGNIAGAAAHLDQALAHRATAPSFQPALAAEAAYLTARYDSGPDAAATAEAWLQLAKPPGMIDSNYRRAEATVRLAQGRATDARAAADDALRLLDRASDIGGATAEREWLMGLREATVAAEGSL